MNSYNGYIKKLKPAKQRLNKHRIYGFDIETCDENREFVCASLYYDEKNKWTFYTKKEVIDFIKTQKLGNCIICATNLSFDFFGTFFNNEEIKNFNLLFRGSNLLYARTYLKDGEFYRKCEHKKNLGRKRLIFLDTLNYAHMSVEKLGKIIGVPKIDSPSFLGQKPMNDEEWRELVDYNMRDSEISKKFMDFIYKTFEELGASPKMTIASTSMSLFKNKYLTSEYYVHDTDVLLKQFQGYYGGRTEAFKRGKLPACNYYDINSLYPSVMLKEYPNPNTLKIDYSNTIKFLVEFEGMSHVRVWCPKMKYPLLPLRTTDKLLFPTGTFEGWHCNVELRKALKLGYKIEKVYESHYYTATCRPFAEFVKTLYKLRKKLKKEGNNMQVVVKLLLNSLYGKFGQKFEGRDNWHSNTADFKDMQKYDKMEVCGDFVRTVEDSEPSTFCFPIWASYVTSYGRIALYDYIVKLNPFYVDTDSVMTESTLETSDKIGRMKLEGLIYGGFIVKPKFYALRGKFERTDELVKIKGLGMRVLFKDFTKLLDSPHVDYKKFCTFKESIRRGFIPNEIINVSKQFALEDNKREWLAEFSRKNLQDSEALEV